MENNNRQGCRWTKCSDRLPDKRHNYHVKVIKNDGKTTWYWNTASLWNLKDWEHPSQYDSLTGLPKKINVYEWLDESPIEPCATSSENYWKQRCEAAELRVIELEDRIMWALQNPQSVFVFNELRDIVKEKLK